MFRLVTIFCLITISDSAFGQLWHNLGFGMLGGGTTCLYPSDKLYIGTSCNGTCTFNGMPVNGICTLDDDHLDTLGTGFYNSSVNDAVWYNGKLVVGGDFGSQGYWPGMSWTAHIAAWDSLTGWSSITPNGFCDGDVEAMTIYNGDLYIAGMFSHVDGVSCHRIARWDGTTWHPVGGGVSGWTQRILCMEVFQNKLIVAGDFGMAGSLLVNRVASWDGVAWGTVGLGFDSWVLDLLADTNANVLYACGHFAMGGSFITKGIAQWNGSGWYPVGSGSIPFYGSYCMVIYDSVLVVGGAFYNTNQQGDALNYLVAYKDSMWTAFHGGTNLLVTDLAVYNGDLYVGGNFNQVGQNNMYANRIACYGPTCPTISDVGMFEQNSALTFNVSPNPVSDIIHLTSDEQSDLIFRFYNNMGQLLIEQKFRNQIDYCTEELAAGYYTVQVSVEDGSRTHSETLIIK